MVVMDPMEVVAVPQILPHTWESKVNWVLTVISKMIDDMEVMFGVNDCERLIRRPRVNFLLANLMEELLSWEQRIRGLRVVKEEGAREVMITDVPVHARDPLVLLHETWRLHTLMVAVEAGFQGRLMSSSKGRLAFVIAQAGVEPGKSGGVQNVLQVVKSLQRSGAISETVVEQKIHFPLYKYYFQRRMEIVLI